jgi:hypothetical protein
MAPTKAKATYAVRTLSLPTKVMGTLPWLTSLPAITRETSKAFPGEKVSAAVHPTYPQGRAAGNVVKES